MTIVQSTPIYGMPNLDMTGLIVERVPGGAGITVYEGTCKDSTNTIDMGIGSNFAPLNGPAVDSPITVSLTTNGYNGLDTGTIAIDTWYAVYIIGDSSYNNPVGAILTLATNSVPTLPFGYDSYRLRYYVLTSGTPGVLTAFFMEGAGSNVRNVFDAPIAVLTAGTATTFTAVDLTAAVPPVSSINIPSNMWVDFQASYTPAVAGNTFNIRTGASATATGLSMSAVVAAVIQVYQFGANAGYVMADSAMEVEYKVTASDALSLSVVGFEFRV